MNSILATIIQGIVVLAIAPFALGLVRMLKARLQGRQGASPFLTYISFATLCRKQMVISPTTSWIFRAVPFVVLATAIFLALVLPLLYRGGVLASLSDFVVVAGVLALGAVFLVLGGLDPGSAFGGMGSSREMTIAALLEPAIIMVFGTLSIITQSSTIDGMAASLSLLQHPALLLSVLALVLIALAENARYPVDNPATHLELTMVHEAMVLEYSGPYLAMLEYASALKLTVFTLLISSFLFPWSSVNVSSSFIAVMLAIVYVIIKVVIGMALLALLESTIAKMRFFRMQEYLSAAFFIGLFGLVVALLT